MTIGIYLLYYDNINEVYVGQSVNIERRFKQHKYNLKLGTHCNKKLSDLYAIYGCPNLSVIETCVLSELNDKELFWIKEFNSIKDGLNIIENSNGSGIGYNQSNSIYTKLQILKVFRYSYLHSYIHLTIKEISEITKVSISAIESIRASITHLWLKDVYPKQYVWMRNSSVYRNRKIKSEVYNLMSPLGIIFSTTNITKFSKLHSLDRGNLNRLINGKAKSVKGWTKA